MIETMVVALAGAAAAGLMTWGLQRRGGHVARAAEQSPHQTTITVTLSYPAEEHP